MLSIIFVRRVCWAGNSWAGRRVCLAGLWKERRGDEVSFGDGYISEFSD